MNHQRTEAIAAIRPTTTEVIIASDVITAALADGLKASTDLATRVQTRFNDEPLPDVSSIEGVEPIPMRGGKAVGAAAIALAHLEATGHILPYGGRRIQE